MTHYQLTAVIWKEGRQYVSKCPELGVASCGPSLVDAGKALKEAVELYLGNARKLGILSDLAPMLKSESRFTTPLDVAA